MKPIQVGLLGIGTVGSGVFNVLARNQDEIAHQCQCLYYCLWSGMYRRAYFFAPDPMEEATAFKKLFYCNTSLAK